MNPIEVERACADNLSEPLHLLEEWLRDSEPVPDAFAEEIRHKVAAGDLEFLTARQEGRTVGVLVLAFRTNISLGGQFASVEDLYVTTEARRLGVGSALLKAAEQRCKARSISYLEAQVEGSEASQFYATSGFEEERSVRVFSRSLIIESGAKV